MNRVFVSGNCSSFVGVCVAVLVCVGVCVLVGV